MDAMGRLSRIVFGLLGLLIGCSDENKPVADTNGDQGIPATPDCPLRPADSMEEAESAVRALYLCQGTEEGALQVTCSTPIEEWTYYIQDYVDGRGLVGQVVTDCVAAVEGEPELGGSYRITLGPLLLPPAGDPSGTPRCYQEYNASCFLPGREGEAPRYIYPAVATVEDAEDWVAAFMECQGCEPDEHQVDCWGPSELLWDQGSRVIEGVRQVGWITLTCRVFDLIQPGTVEHYIPFGYF